VKEWSRLEDILIKYASTRADGVATVREATVVLAEAKLIDLDMLSLLDDLRRFRNTVVHKWQEVEPEEVTAWTEVARRAATEFGEAMQAA
jgi:uncharacterized protein YutE (UPF0331/DUF86 family)